MIARRGFGRGQGRAVIAIVLVAASCGEIVPSSTTDAGAGDDGGMADGNASADAAPPDKCMGDEIQFEDLRECMIQAQCAFVIGCGVFRLTAEECPAFVANNTADMDVIVDAVESGRVEFDGEKAVQCLASFRAVPQSCLLGPGDVCEDAFIGTVPPADPCFVDEECAGSGSECDDGGCDNDVQCCAGTCVAANNTNEPCGADTGPCMHGDECVFDAGLGENRCYPGDEGSYCGSSSDCDNSFYCFDNTCTPRKGPGAPCDENAECAPPTSCVGEDIGLGTCQRIDRLGDSCDSTCVGPLNCHKDGDPIGTCSPPIPEGGPCETASECAGSNLCSDDGFCVPRIAAGMACNSGECQIGLICSSELPGGTEPGNCIEPRASGMTCDNDNQCQTGICNESTVPGSCEEYQNCYE